MNKKNLTCQDVLDHICVNLDEDLNSPACRAVKIHLNECPECASYLKSLKNTINLYKNYPSPILSPSAKHSIEGIIQEKIKRDS